MVILKLINWPISYAEASLASKERDTLYLVDRTERYGLKLKPNRLKVELGSTAAKKAGQAEGV